MIKEVVSKPLPNIKESDKCRFWSKVTLMADPHKCWEWSGNKRRRGYGRISITVAPQKDVSVIATRMAYFLHYNVDPVGKAVLHKCDNPSCCNPHHLFLGTSKDNTDDMFKKKRANPPNGTQHWASKLGPEAIEEIKKLRSEGMTQGKIAFKFKVYQSVISRVLSGDAWKHINKN